MDKIQEDKIKTIWEVYEGIRDEDKKIIGVLEVISTGLPGYKDVLKKAHKKFPEHKDKFLSTKFISKTKAESK